MKSINPLLLATWGEMATKFPQWQQEPDGNTHCNAHLAHTALLFDCPAFFNGAGNPYMANQIAEMILHSSDFREVMRFDEVQHLANSGAFIVCLFEAEPHGHVCYPVPAKAMHLSPSYGCEVPIVANVGPRQYTGIVPLSEAYSPEHRPRMFLFEPQPVAMSAA